MIAPLAWSLLLAIGITPAAAAETSMTDLKEGRYRIVAALQQCEPPQEKLLCAVVYPGGVLQRHLPLQASKWSPSLASAAKGAPKVRWELQGEWKGGVFSILKEPRLHHGRVAPEAESNWIRKLD